jgi:hypothetical protein
MGGDVKYIVHGILMWDANNKAPNMGAAGFALKAWGDK